MLEPQFKMYIKPSCPFCKKAKHLISNDLGLPLALTDVTDNDVLRNELIEETGIKTVPIIYLGDHLIGGCSDLEESMLSGKMEVLLLKEEISLLKKEIDLLRRSA